jgi:hypothetical protein
MTITSTVITMRTGELWRVTADNSGLEAPVRIALPNVTPECEPYEQDLLGIGTGGKLFLFERFGGKLDRRVRCIREIPGGVSIVDPRTGRILAHLASDLHFASLISSADGKKLYGVDVSDPNWTSVGIVQLDASTGGVFATRELDSDVWFIDLATVPRELVPRGQVETMAK